MRHASCLCSLQCSSNSNLIGMPLSSSLSLPRLCVFHFSSAHYTGSFMRYFSLSPDKICWKHRSSSSHSSAETTSQSPLRGLQSNILLRALLSLSCMCTFRSERRYISSAHGVGEATVRDIGAEQRHNLRSPQRE